MSVALVNVVLFDYPYVTSRAGRVAHETDWTPVLEQERELNY